MKHVTILGLFLFSLPAPAQNTFELPRDCLERQVADPSRCVIQDGPPQRVYPNTRNVNKPAPANPAAPGVSTTKNSIPTAPLKATR